MRLAHLLLVTLALMTPGWLIADDLGQERRSAVATGQRVPLRTLLERLETEYLGEVIEVEL